MKEVAKTAQMRFGESRGGDQNSVPALIRSADEFGEDEAKGRGV